MVTPFTEVGKNIEFLFDGGKSSNIEIRSFDLFQKPSFQIFMKICQVQPATGYINTEFGGNVWTGETDLVLASILYI